MPGEAAGSDDHRNAAAPLAAATIKEEQVLGDEALARAMVAAAELAKGPALQIEDSPPRKRVKRENVVKELAEATARSQRLPQSPAVDIHDSQSSGKRSEPGLSEKSEGGQFSQWIAEGLAAEGLTEEDLIGMGTLDGYLEAVAQGTSGARGGGHDGSDGSD